MMYIILTRPSLICEFTFLILYYYRLRKRTVTQTLSSTGCPTPIAGSVMSAEISSTHSGGVTTVASVVRSSAVDAVTKKCQENSWATPVKIVLVFQISLNVSKNADASSVKSLSFGQLH